MNEDLISIILRSAGPFFFIGLQMSSLLTAMRIVKMNSVENLSPIPFLSLFTNGFVWFMYGVQRADYTVMVGNFFAILTGGICVIIYHFNSEKKVSITLYVVSISIIFPSVILALYKDQEIIGLIGVVLSVILMGSPLSTVYTVIKEKKTNSMPFLTSLASFFNSLSWTLYGYLVALDPLLWMSSAVGLLLVMFQLCLFVIYGLPTSEIEKKFMKLSENSVLNRDGIVFVQMKSYTNGDEV
jgi:solute carrier family 50 protein (sugar transporter)